MWGVLIASKQARQRDTDRDRDTVAILVQVIRRAFRKANSEISDFSPCSKGGQGRWALLEAPQLKRRMEMQVTADQLAKLQGKQGAETPLTRYNFSPESR